MSGQCIGIHLRFPLWLLIAPEDIIFTRFIGYSKYQNILSTNWINYGTMVLDSLDPSDVFFQMILQKGMSDKTIQDVTLLEKTAAVKTGENYLSYLTRLILKYVSKLPKGHPHENTIHLILKEEPKAHIKTLDYLREANVFNTEMRMLEKIVPKIEKLIGKRLGPKVFYSSSAPHTIVMEDLVALGFQNKNRKVGFNEAETFLVLDYLADFHAGSLALYEQNPAYVTHFGQGFFHDKTPQAFYKFVQMGLASVADTVRTWPNEKFITISDKLRKQSNVICEKLLKSYKCDEKEFRVLNHGDLWMNNIMFRNGENDEPREIRFVDYQMCVWTSPAIDLLYFLSIAPETSIKASDDDTFLHRYLSRLSNTMNRLSCSAKPPTLGELKTSMYKRRYYALMAGVTFYPKMIAEDDEIEPIDDILERGEAKIDLLKNPTVQTTIKKFLPILLQRGYLD